MIDYYNWKLKRKGIRMKKLLLIAPVFFGYYKEIIKEAELLGYEVDYVCDAPSNSNVSKAVGRINKNLIKVSTKKYFNNNVLPIISNKKYDDVFIIGGMTFSFTIKMVKKIKELNSNAKFSLYQWDSEKNLPYSTKIHPFIDKIYTFDLNDFERNNIYIFLPLFYTRMYEKIGSEDKNSFIYDCSYVGTAHPQKYKDINNISNALKVIMPKQFIYHYMPSKLKYYYHKIFSPEFKNAKFREFKTEKLSSNEMNNIFKESRCILDAPQSGQTGLTIRTIECLGAKRKLVTTNFDVKKYDFYDERNILVFEGKIDFNNVFFNSPFIDLDKDIYSKYSLREWLKTILHEEEK